MNRECCTLPFTDRTIVLLNNNYGFHDNWAIFTRIRTQKKRPKKKKNNLKL